MYYAAEIGCEKLLSETFGNVVIPIAVHEELLAVNHLSFIQRLLSSPWLQVQPAPAGALLSDLLLHSDRGESEAIVLSLELSAAFLLIDERRGDAVAVKFGLNTVGLLGFFITAKDKGVIREVKPWIERLTTQTKFRHSKKLIDAVLKLANELS